MAVEYDELKDAPSATMVQLFEFLEVSALARPKHSDNSAMAS
jgi:hypothetical protein